MYSSTEQLLKKEAEVYERLLTVNQSRMQKKISFIFQKEKRHLIVQSLDYNEFA